MLLIASREDRLQHRPCFYLLESLFSCRVALLIMTHLLPTANMNLFAETYAIKRYWGKALIPCSQLPGRSFQDTCLRPPLIDRSAMANLLCLEPPHKLNLNQQQSVRSTVRPFRRVRDEFSQANYDVLSSLRCFLVVRLLKPFFHVISA